MTLPLARVQILDLTRLLPGGVATMLLADMGAEVVKVESPDGGDYARWMPPLLDGQGALFRATNRGKRSAIIDLKDERGQEALKKLAATAGVLIEGNRPGVMARLNCDYDSLKALNPGLIYCSLSGWGQDGPYRNLSGHDLNYAATGGLLANGQSQPLGGQIADIGGAYAAVSAILAALFQRERSGEGCYLDVSLFEAALPFALQPWVEALTAEQAGLTPGMLTGEYACYNIYPAQDGVMLTLAALEPKFWANFANAVERPDFLAGSYLEPQRQPELKAAVAELFASQPAAEWAALLKQVDCCFAVVNSLDAVGGDPQIRARGMLGEQADNTPWMRSPLRLDGGESRAMPAPAYGEHTRIVLLGAGYTPEEVETLIAEGICAPRP